MWAPIKLPAGREAEYGLGWCVNDYQGRRVVGHSGGDPGFATCFSRFPKERVTVAVCANLGGNLFLGVHEALFELTGQLAKTY
jgi:CubicO group peptidase (beta-lactamase class C family)